MKHSIINALLILACIGMVVVLGGEFWTLWNDPAYFLPRPSPTPTLMGLPQFAASVQNGSTELVGVYATGHFAFPVAGEGWQETTRDLTDNLVWQDDLRPTTLLNAHNGLAGTHFLDLRVGDEVALVYGDGCTDTYIVTTIEQYQVVTEADGDHFVDLDTGAQMSWAQLIQTHMPGPDTLAFATCLANGDNKSWGRTFVFATKSK